MAKIRINSSNSVVVDYKGGGVVAASIKWSGQKGSYVIRTQPLRKTNAETLEDFSSALRIVCVKVAEKIRKSINLAGTPVDPDEETIIPGKDLTVTYKIFAKEPANDKAKMLSFTWYTETGRVGADLQKFEFSDIPSAVQVAAVAVQAAGKMKKYARLQN